MPQTIGLLIVAIVFVWVLYHGLFMVLWPSRWTRLPDYIAGPFRGANLKDTRNGRLQIRAAGLVMLILIGNLAFSILSRSSYRVWDRLPSLPNDVFLVFVILGMGGWGTFFLFRPEKALRLTFSQLPASLDADSRNKVERILTVFIRANGALFTLGAAYLAWTRLGLT